MKYSDDRLHTPLFYSFDKRDIGRIVLFQCQKENVLHPYMIIFNAYKKNEEDDDILFRHQLTDEIWNMHRLCLEDFVYTVIKDTHLDEIEFNTIHERTADMGAQKLQLILQEDGDVCLALMNGETDPKEFERVSLEFCSIGSGGGKSPHTLNALRNLIVAIKKDNDQNGQ